MTNSISKCLRVHRDTEVFPIPNGWFYGYMMGFKNKRYFQSFFLFCYQVSLGIAKCIQNRFLEWYQYFRQSAHQGWTFATIFFKILHSQSTTSSYEVQRADVLFLGERSLFLQFRGTQQTRKMENFSFAWILEYSIGFFGIFVELKSFTDRNQENSFRKQILVWMFVWV